MFTMGVIDDALRAITQMQSKRFSGKPLVVALEDCLEETGGSCEWEDMLKMLTRGGVDRPEFLHKNLRIVITKNRDRFTIDGETVRFALPRDFSYRVA